METEHILLGLLEAVVWYVFIYYWLDTIRKPGRNLWIAAAVLHGLFYLGFVLCLWIRESEAWRTL